MTSRLGMVPKEEDEQMAFVQWCRIMGIRVHHSPLEFASSSRTVKVRALKMKKMGTSKGFPDLLVFVPVCGVDGGIDSYQMCAIEMKRRKGSKVSEEQKEWLEVLQASGAMCAVCKGADEAIQFVETIMKEIQYE